jgi:dipeptidyl aminopeptidase/acylaminoacyl peptidase
VYNRGGSRDYGKLTVLNVLRSMVPFAQAGYLVFASNYRGNAGSEGHEEFGGDDVRDVLRLLEIARSHGRFDGKNAFMAGHSRGGMMTCMAVKQGAQVNAAISIAGIGDARKLVDYPNILNNVLKPLVPGFADDPEAALALRSAVLWPEAIGVPLVLLHGDNDKDVHVSDSIALQAAIRAAGGVAELVVYPGGSHALVRSWSDVVARSLAWMERYSV